MNRIKPTAAAAILLLSFLLNLCYALAQDNPPPGAPRDLTLTDVGETYARFEWTSPGDDDIVCYYIYKNSSFLQSTVSLATNFSAMGLKSGTIYTFKVSAWDGCSEGPFSNEITVTTESSSSNHGNATGSISYPKDGQRLNALDSISGTASDSDGTVIKVGLLITDSEGRYLKPDMFCFETPKDTEDYHIPVRSTGMNYSTWELGIHDFSVFTDGEYLIRVCPNDGMYATSGQAHFAVDTTPPGPPEGLSAQDITDSAVKLLWDSPADSDTEGYHVYRNGEYLTSTALTSLNVNSLAPDTSYSFCVAAHDGLNAGIPCDALEVTTQPGTPDPPADPPDAPGDPPPSSERRSSSRTVRRQKPPEYKLSEYVNPDTGRTETEATIIIGQAWGNKHLPQDGNILVDTTNYFPGKQISRETFILEEPLLYMAVKEGRDIIVNGGLAGLYLGTSQYTAENFGAPFEVSIQRKDNHPLLLRFFESRPAFEPVHEALLYQLRENTPAIPAFARIPLPEGLKEGCRSDYRATGGKGLLEGCRVGYITCGEEGSIFCRYDGIGFTDGDIMFPVCRNGIQQTVLYKNPYTGYKGHWSERELDRVLAEGVYAPPDTSVDPDARISRSLFASMLRAAAGVVTDTEQCTGQGENDGQPITRCALAQMAAGVVDKTADFGTAVRMGLLIGFGDGSLQPDRPATLAEAAVVLCRLADNNRFK